MIDLEKEKAEKLKLQKKFGKHLVKVRESAGLTPAELGRLCFLDRSTIARLEGGRTNPTLFVVQKLAKAMNLTVSQFYQEFDDKK